MHDTTVCEVELEFLEKQCLTALLLEILLEKISELDNARLSI